MYQELCKGGRGMGKDFFRDHQSFAKIERFSVKFKQ